MRAAAFVFPGLAALALAVPTLCAGSTRADDGARRLGGGFLSAVWENDLFAGEDRKYTNGAFLRYTAPPDSLPGWGLWLKDRLGGLTPAQTWSHAYALGHFIFTSSDITDPEPPPDDRPYAAALVGTATLFADAGDRLDAFTFDLALVGPPALGEEVQTWVHDNITGDDPKGWDTQLETEIAFRGLYEQTRRYPLAELAGLEVDALPAASVALGTLETSVGAGLRLRLGRNLADDYGPDRVRRSVAGPSFAAPGGGWQVYAGVDGLAVARNLFLDGNTFRDSRSTDKEPFVAEFTLGASYAWENTVISYTHVFRTEEFEAQDDWGVFGSLNLRVRF